MLEIKDLHVEVNAKKILNGVTLAVNPGEVHALLGPNGSGKSTLCNAIAGNPNCKITKGKINYNGKDLAKLKPEERALAGLFLSFQNPVEIPGVTLFNFLYKMAKLKRKISPFQFRQELETIIEKIGFEESFLDRELNVGFSGGEKKRAEVLQLILANPSLAILDENDSGLDVDALKTIGQEIQTMCTPTFSALIITHYARLLQYVKPKYVHVMKNGKIAKSGGVELLKEIENNGYNGEEK